MALWIVAIELGILAASLIASYYLRPDVEQVTAEQIEGFGGPRAQEGDAVPIAYGTVRINAPTVLEFDVQTNRPLPIGGDVVVGYEYLAQMRMLFCRSNARVEVVSPPQAQLVGFYIGDKLVTLDGPNYRGDHGGIDDTAGNASYYIDEPSGSESDGRTFGDVFFYDGRWDTVLRADEALAIVSIIDVPYRGMVTMRFWNWHVQANQLAPYSPVIFNPCVIPGYESTTGAIGQGDCNPAAVIYDLLTNPWGGLGNDGTLVDTTSFTDAAAVLEDEQHGCSLVIGRPNEARGIIEQLLRQIDGVLYQNMDTNRYVLKLIREDYDPLTIPEFTQANVLEAPEMPGTLWSETYNEVKIIFTDSTKDFNQGTAIEQDLAGISISGGRVRTQEIHFPGVRDPNLAQQLAARELNFLSRPIATIRMVVNRQGWDLVPGDAFKFTWSEWGYTLIFRVAEIDLGELENGRIVVTGVQDRFSIVGTAFDPPGFQFPIGEPPTTPDPIQDRIVTEAPRWIQVQAFDAGLINSPDVQRSYSLARPEGTDSRYRLDTSINAADEAADLGGRTFPTTFTLAASYAYYQGPYDTTIGILVENLDGSFSSASATEIREQGKNVLMLWDDDGNHEILSFESAADLGGGTYQLENVSRGLMDTVPRTWAGGTPGALLPGTGGVSAMGRLALRYGFAITTHMPAASGSTWTPTAFSPADSFTAASRTLRPVRVADLEIDGGQQPDPLEEGGVALSWKIRNRTTATITRGDAADEAVESGQTYDAVAYKGTGAQVVLVSGHTSSTTAEVELGKVGHGALEVGVDTKRTVTLPDGSTPVLRGWQVPTIPITAHHWRNILRNGRFAGYSGTGGMDGWTTIGGTPQAASTLPLGSAGYYVRGTAAAGTTTIQQDVDVSGYPAHMLRAVLDFYCRLLPDSDAPDDTVTVTLYGLDSGGATVASTTYGPGSPATWTKQTLSLANLDVTVVTLRVRIVLTAVGTSGDITADVGVTEMILRLGQITSLQLLTNPSFEDGGGSTTGWTASSGTWQVIGAGAYEQTYYTRPNDGASAQLRQTVPLPTGHELGAAVLELARCNDAADDTGEVILEALDAGASVLDSVTTGAEAIAGSLTWERRRLVLDPIPALTTDLRVTINATRVTGTPLNACFDDFDLRTHKHLDADQEVSATWDAPVIQYLPRSAMEWKFRWPTVTVPDYAIYDGTANGRVGIEPLLGTVGTGAKLNGKAVAYDGTNLSTTAFEGYTPGAGGYVATNPSGTLFCNFTSADSFTVLAFVRIPTDAPLGDGFGICGRMSDSVGWELRVTDTDGFPQVRVTGDGGAATVTGGTTIADGGLHAVCLVYNGTADTLRLISTAGTSSTGTGAIGELSTDVPGKFRILWAAESEAETFIGQVLRVYIWDEAMATADIQSLMTYAETGDLTSQTRTGTVACVVGSDTTGVLVDAFPADRPAVLFDDASDRYGLLSLPAIDNLATAATVTDSGTVEDDAAADPTGFYQAIRIEGADGDGRVFEDITFGVAASVYVQCMAKASSAHDASVALVDTGMNNIDKTTIALTTSWQVFNITLAWDGSTGVGGVLFSGSDDGSTQEIYLSPIVSASLVQPYPGAFPIGSPGATAPVMAIALTDQLNREGEIEIEVASLDADCTLADLHNGTNDNDRRTISWDADAVTPIVASDHYNASGTNNANAAISGTAIDPTAPWVARLRWNRAGTLDGSLYITDVRAEQGATVEVDAGRNVVFTASTTAVDELELGHKADGSAVMAGVIFGVTVRAREEKVTPP